MTSSAKATSKPLIFLDELFLSSPLCQICKYANWGLGGVCSLLLNRQMPAELVIKGSRIVFCSFHRNWVESIESDRIK